MTTNVRAVARAGAGTGSRMVVPNRTRGTILKLVVVIIGTVFALYPFLIIVGTSFDARNNISGASIIPRQFSMENYEKLFNSAQTPIVIWLGNSIFVSGVSTVITLALTTFAAFAFSRFRYSGRRASLLATLIIQVFPTVVALVAFYLLLDQLKDIAPFFGLNSLGGVILIYCGGALGANAFLMKGYFDTIPREIDESAMVDGATHWITFTRIILPLIRPILAVVGILAFIGTFNDYLIPRVILRDTNNLTLAVGLTTFLGNNFAVDWGVFAAGALIGTFPIIIVFILLQTQIVSGLSQGAVKG
jgi:arabinogalactan oligomer/maltooligosaccharide transport system permease protein